MLEGIFAPIPTPFVAGAIAWDRLQDNVYKWSQTSLAGLVVLGSNGEFPLLKAEEKIALVQKVREWLPLEKKVIAGTGCEGTEEAVELCREYARAGADCALVLNPHFYKESYGDRALMAFYLSIAECSPLPLVLYNMPRNTGLNLAADLVIALSRHENIVGIKDSSGNVVQMAEICQAARADFAVMAGSASFLLPALAVGAVGGTMALANIMPEECGAVLEHFVAGRLAEARTLQWRLLAPNAAVTTRWGVAGLKAALDYLGYFGGEPRPPHLPLLAPEREKLIAVLKAAGL
ncbi:MAG: 4-hydroxy-tetrahydrodipicolinate synthase [Firmicutes bacterium]|nr:4-hydroxy-tetrahydrodipicolinate synthase [Bacillota bacterium]